MSLTNYPLVTFIVPLFNKEEYILETLKSLHDCHYPNKEIFIVDDASTDNSLAITESFCAGKNNMKILKRSTNSGLSAARNTGLECATGKYIQFWDADDVYDKDGLTKIIDIMEKNNSEIATAIATRDGEIHGYYKKMCVLNENTNMDESTDIFNTNSTCFKIYNNEFLSKNNLTFVENLHVQDYEFNFRALLLAKRVAVTPYILGEYRKVENSSGRVMNEDKVKAPLIIDELTKAFLIANNLTRFEAYRQYKTIKMVYTFFIRRLLNSNSEEVKKYAFEYLSKYKDSLSKLNEGVKTISKTDSKLALCIIAITKGNFQLAEQVFLQPYSLPFNNMDNLINPLTENVLGFNETEIEALYRNVQRIVPELLKGISYQLQVKMKYFKNRILSEKLIIENLFLKDINPT